VCGGKPSTYSACFSFVVNLYSSTGAKAASLAGTSAIVNNVKADKKSSDRFVFAALFSRLNDGFRLFRVSDDVFFLGSTSAY